MQYAMPFLNFLLSWCCLTHFCKWKKNILVTEQNPDSKSCYLVHNEHQPTALIWPLVDDSCRLPRIPLLVESLWRVFFLGACPGNDKIYCNQLANNSITLVWGGYVFSSFAAASPVAKTVAWSGVTFQLVCRLVTSDVNVPSTYLVEWLNTQANWDLPECCWIYLLLNSGKPSVGPLAGRMMAA